MNSAQAEGGPRLRGVGLSVGVTAQAASEVTVHEERSKLTT
jgi:hypothetical protein